MRVALVCPYDLSVPGGVQTQVEGQAQALAELGHHVCVLAPGTVGTWDVAGARSVQLGPSIRLPANGSFAPVSIRPKALRRAVQALADFDPDVVHIHEPLVPGPALAVLARAQAPIVATFHRARPSHLYALYGRLVRRFGRRIDARAAVSQAASETVRAVLGDVEVSIIPNAVAAGRLARRPPIDGTPPTALFVGRIEPRKGLQVLLEAFHGLAGDFSLRVVGGGRERKALERKYASDDRICFLGQLSNDARDRELASADVFVSPALGGESFGVVLLEAMAAGCAVIASDLPGYRVAADDAAWYVPPGNVKALREKLRALLCDPDSRAQLAAAARERATNFSFDALAARYLALYDRAIDTARSKHPRHGLLASITRHRTLVGG
jgi:phosphatidyl-myo-inositol alpha-mannosyltransferase